MQVRLRMPEPHTHLLHVETVLTGVAAPLRLVMPSWTPGSYLIREFPRNVQAFSAVDGRGDALPWTKIDKNRWEIAAPADGTVRALYRVYANEISVRTSHLDASHGYVNGASVFMYAEGDEREPIALDVDAPEGWRVTTALPWCERSGQWRAGSYDELVDCPIEIGTHELVEWEMDGRRFRYAIWGRGNHDTGRLVADTRKIIAAEEALFGGLPVDDYTFILHLVPGGYGGLEHRTSTSLLADRWSFCGTPYEQFLGLVAHEFFHLWNGKRLRPAALGPFDYTRENYTRDLWVVEGFTTYYTDLILRRAGIISEARYLDKLSEMIARLQALPGRQVQTLSESSLDTWIKFYRPDAGTPNAQISYYQKGALVAYLLDMRIRATSGNVRSLDDLLRVLWQRYGIPNVGYPEGAVETIAAEVCGEDLTDFFDRSLRGTDELEYEPALTVAGLELSARHQLTRNGSGPAPEPAAGKAAERLERQTGLRLREELGRTTVTHVLGGSVAYRAGINAGDELVAVDGLRATLADLPARLLEHRAEDAVELAVFRRDELVTLRMETGPAPAPPLQLHVLETASAEQVDVRTEWLRGPAPAATPTLGWG